MNTEKDPLLESFFRDMKDADLKAGVPAIDYREKRKRKRSGRRIFSAIAASIAVIVLSIWLIGGKQSQEKRENLGEIESEIENMMTWQSATDKLLDE